MNCELQYSKITVFTHALKKLSLDYVGKKLGPQVFLIPIQFPLSLIIINKWTNLIQVKEQFLIRIGFADSGL